MKVELNTYNLQKIAKVADNLQGTCRLLDDELEEQFGEGVTVIDLHPSLLEDLDERTMCCEMCGWWCEPDELNHMQECNDCSPDDEEDDE